MKKICAIMVTLLMITTFSTVAYAFNDDIIETAVLEDFEITGGLSEKLTEATFDSVRTITGVAKKGTVVKIVVMKEKDEERVIIREYEEITVSALEVFSQDIELDIGKNIVVITASDGEASMELEAVVKRKSIKIKQELESKNIVLPMKPSLK